ncbi:dynein regulatory complex protein 8 isoform X3 [Mastomys coucha]|uniref:dynein regulatory complex protein 8 isoform X3 n=1 Tax=Mastomys coucha TaxID=35658 RepID=UPI0012626FF2|nr:dynein regulatory complex protein 8 isoform X3 [Mastomys coucha]
MTPLGPKERGPRFWWRRESGGGWTPVHPGASSARSGSRVPQGLGWVSPRRRAPHQDGGGEGLGGNREIGTIIRSLGCCLTEGELHDFIAEVEEDEPTGYIRFEKFLPVMTRALVERKYRPIPEDVLLRAFEVGELHIIHARAFFPRGNGRNAVCCN